MTDQTRPSLDDHAEADLITFSDEDTFEDDQKRRKPKRRWIVLGALTAVAAVVGIMTAPGLVRVFAQKDATLTIPDKVGAYTRDESPAALATASDLVTALRASISLDTAQGAVYTNADQTIMLFGGTALLWNPEDELDAVIKLMEDKDEAGIRDLQTVDPGSLGGIMKCGLTDAQSDSAMAVCGWADHGSIALALFPALTVADAAPLMRDLRSATLTR